MSEPTQTFRSETADYRVEADLGTGQTGLVYRVRATDGTEWALKLLRTAARRNALVDEAVTLQRMRLGAGKDLLTYAGRPLVPEIAEVHLQEPVFVVMSLASGVPLDEVLRRRGRLTERQALFLMAQVARVLRVLHEDLQKSYLDFQPRNIFWQEDQDGVMVLDFDVLASGDRFSPATDIRRVGELFYRMAVGVELPSAGVSAEPGWKDLTLGTQQLIRHALHRSPQMSFADMSAFQAAVDAQLDLWKLPLDGLLRQAESAVNAAKVTAGPDSPGRPKAWQQARNLVDVLNARAETLSGEQRTQLRLLEQAAQRGWAAAGDQLRMGITFMRSADRKHALECFRKAYVESEDFMERLAAKRWQQAALTGGNDETKRTAMAVQEDLTEGRYEAVLRALNDTVVQAGGEPVQALRSDAQTWLAYIKAEQALRLLNDHRGRSYLDAAAQLADVEEILARLPYRELLDEQWGDLPQKIKELEERARQLEAGAVPIEALRGQLANVSDEEIAGELEKAFDGHAGDRSLLELSLELGRAKLNIGNAAVARAIVAVALDHAADAPRDRLAAEWEVADAEMRIKYLLDQRVTEQENLTGSLGLELARMVRQTGSTAQGSRAQAMLSLIMEQAEAQRFPPLADWTVAESERLGMSDSNLSARAVKLKNSIASEQAAVRELIDAQIQQFVVSEAVADQQKAQLLIMAALAAQDLAPERRAELRELKRLADERANQLSYAQAEQDLRSRLRLINERVQRTTIPDELADEIEGLGHLAEEAHAAEFHEVATETQHSINEARRRRQDLVDLAPKLAAVKASLVSAETIAANKGSRDAQLHVLQDARSRLAEIAASGVDAPAVAELTQQVNREWNALGGPDWAGQQAAASAMEPPPQTHARHGQIGQWIMYALLGLLLVAVSGATYFLRDRFNDQQAWLNALGNNVGVLTDRVNAAFPQSAGYDPTGDDFIGIAGSLDALSTEISELLVRMDQIAAPTFDDTQGSIDSDALSADLLSSLEPLIANTIVTATGVASNQTDTPVVMGAINEVRDLIEEQNRVNRVISSTLDTISGTIAEIEAGTNDEAASVVVPGVLPPRARNVTVRYSDDPDSYFADPPPALYVAPWMVEVEVPTWLTPTAENLGLYLVAEDVENTPEALLARLTDIPIDVVAEDDAQIYRYTRTIEGNLDTLQPEFRPDEFPIDTETGTLLPGAYVLSVRPIDDNDTTVLGEAQFVITDSLLAPKAEIVAAAGAARRNLRPQIESDTLGGSASTGTIVSLLGKQEVNGETWYLWQSALDDNPLRRGWNLQTVNGAEVLRIQAPSSFAEIPTIGPTVSE